MAKRVFGIILMFAMIVTLTACGAGKTIIDYGDAESFEADLNAGANLEGKVVQFVAEELHPSSALGYNVWAGEHLNFISSRNPDIKEGDTAVVRATTIESRGGSWFINYEKVDNAEIGATTITGKKNAGNGASDESVSKETSGASSGKGAAGSSSTQDGSKSFGSGTISISADNSSTQKQSIELKDYGWYSKDDNGTAYVNFVGMIYNPNDKFVAKNPKLEVTVRNGDGSIMATKEQWGSVIMPGDTVTLSGNISMPSSDLTEDAQITFEANCYDYDTDSSYYSAARTTDFVFTNVSEREGYISGEVTNNFSEEVNIANIILILRKNGEIVHIWRDDLSHLTPGKAKPFEFQQSSGYPDHDTIELSAMAW